MKKIIFISFLICSFFFSCSPPRLLNSLPINQGISGLITQVSGNQMPMKGVPSPVPKGIVTTVYIYAPTNINQVTKSTNPTQFSFIKTQLLATVETDSTGFFSVQLNPGKYSVFIKQGDLFYANIFDASNNIALFTVEEGKLTKISLSVNSAATY